MTTQIYFCWRCCCRCCYVCYSACFIVRIELSGLPVIQAASANQRVQNSNPRENPEEWPPYLAYMFKLGNTAKDRWIPNKTFEISIDPRSLMTTDVSGNRTRMRQITFNLNAGIRMKSSCIPPVITAPHGGRVESLWDCNYGRQGLGKRRTLYCPIFDFPLENSCCFPWGKPGATESRYQA